MTRVLLDGLQDHPCKLNTNSLDPQLDTISAALFEIRRLAEGSEMPWNGMAVLFAGRRVGGFYGTRNAKGCKNYSAASFTNCEVPC